MKAALGGAMLLAAAFGNVALAGEALPVSELVVEKVVPFEVTYSHQQNYDTRLEFAFGSLWTVVHPNLVRIDPVSYEQTRIELPGLLGPVRPIASGEGAIWVADTGSNIVFKIDPVTNLPVQQIKTSLLAAQSTLALGAGSLWIVTAENAERILTRINAETGDVEAKINLPQGSPAGVAFESDSAWVTGPKELYRIDPKTNAVVATIAICTRPSDIAAGGGFVWVHCRDGFVNRIDGATGAVTATLDIGVKGPGMVDLTVQGGALWIATLVTQLIQIDSASAVISRSFEGRDLRLEAVVTYGDGSLWMLRLRPKGEILRLGDPG